MLSRGQAHLASRMASKVSRSVTYKRGALEVTVNATFGRTEWGVEREGDRVNIASESRDFVINTDELFWDAVDGGGVIRPERLDQIIDVDATTGKTITFEVMPFGPTRQMWRYSGSQRQRIRIHTKQVSEVET